MLGDLCLQMPPKGRKKKKPKKAEEQTVLDLEALEDETVDDEETLFPSEASESEEVSDADNKQTARAVRPSSCCLVTF
jgi:hypothetical protein